MSNTPNFSALGASSEAEKNGVWRSWSDGEHDFEFLIARAGGANTAFRVAAEKQTRPFRRAGLNVEELPPARQDKITAAMFAEFVLLDWKGEMVADIPYTKENGIALFEASNDALLFVVREANNANNYRASALKEEAGN